MNRKVFSKLPDVFKTDIQRKFFDATVEQAFSKRQIEKINGYIGRRDSGNFDPKNDYYKPELNKNRTRYQLEPVVNTSVQGDQVYSFYYDFVNYLRLNNSNLDENLSFSSTYASFSPPINIDMFINYQNYYWVPDLSDPIRINGMNDNAVNSILGLKSFSRVVSSGGVDYDVEFKNGIIVTFPNSSSYRGEFFVEGVGKSIRLINIEDINPSGSEHRIELPDYVTITRGSTDGNHWSRTNRWVHVTSIELNNLISGKPFQGSAIRATKPVICFDPELELFHHGSTFVGDYDLVVNSLNGYPNTYNGILNEYGFSAFRNATIVNIEDKKVYRVSRNSGNLGLTEVRDLELNDSFMARLDNSGSTNSYFHMSSDGVTKNKHQKGDRNVPPKFNMYDIDSVSLSDNEKYPLSTFDGNEIFMFSTGDDSQYRIDPDTGFRLIYGSLEQVSEINFDNKLLTQRYSYVSGGSPIEIKGHYFFFNKEEGKFSNSWHESSNLTKQRAVSKFVAMSPNDTAYELDVTPLNGKESISVTVGSNDNVEFEYVRHNEKDWINVTGTRLDENTDVTVYIDTETKTYELDSFMETPINLSHNPMSDDVYTVTYGEISPHMLSIIKNNIVGDNPRLRDSGYNESAQDLSLGDFIIKVAHSNPNANILSVESMDLLQSIKSSMIDYENFKSKLIKYSNKIDVNSIPRESMALNYILSEVVEMATLSSEFLESYTNSMMCPVGSPTSESELMVGQELREVITKKDSLDLGFDLSNVSIVVLDNDGNQISYTIDGEKVHFQNEGNLDHTVQITFLGIQQNDTRYNLLSNTVNHSITLVDDYYIDGYKKQKIMVYGHDYAISSINGNSEIIFYNSIDSGDTVTLSIFDSTSDKSLVPPTPTKLGMLGAHRPMIVLDDTYVTPMYVIVGHDGSKVPVFGEYSSMDVENIMSGNMNTYEVLRKYDMRDLVLLHFETMVYNQIAKNYNSKIDAMSSSIQSILNGSGYKFSDYFSVLSEECLMWLTESELEHETNSTYDPTEWKTWNYDTSISKGSWKKIYLELYGCVDPHRSPWKLLGFTQKPSWWDNSYDTGDGFSGYGSDYSDANVSMWADIEHGVIRRGRYKGVTKNKYHGICGLSSISALDPNDNEMMDLYTGPSSNSNKIPVKQGNELKTITEILGSNIDHSDSKWDLNHISPVTYAWMTTSAYRYAMVMANYIIRPYEFTTIFSDVDNIQLIGSQIIDRRTSFSVDYSNVNYHDANSYIRGWSQFLFDFMKKSAIDTKIFLSEVLNNVSVNLGNKVGGYTDPIGMKMYLDRLTVGGDSGSLLIPSEDYSVNVHTGAPFKVATMSGIIVSISDNGYRVFGYDVKDPKFKFFPKKTNSSYSKITMGGEPYKFSDYDYDMSYSSGEIIRKNNTFFRAIKDPTVGAFDPSEWKKLDELPTKGGISANVYHQRKDSHETVSYGHEFKSIDDLVDFIIGYGEFLIEQGWSFDEVNDNGEVDDWFKSVRSLLFWLSTNWDVGNSLAICPSANKLRLRFEHGIPDPILSNRNGAYNITDKYGYPVSYRDLIIDRNVPDGYIDISPKSFGDGIFFARVHLSETEHVIVVDNKTSFNDVIFSGLLGTRQSRLRVSMSRTLNWSGHYSADGYLISNGELIPNFDTTSDLSKLIHGNEVYSSDIRDAANHMIGFERKQYMEELGISDEAQYDFHKGFLSEKGTTSSIWSILKSSSVFSGDSITFSEEWALRNAELGSVSNETKISISSRPLEVSLNPQAYTMDLSDPTGYYISAVNFLNKSGVYSSAPTVVVTSTSIPIREAKLEAVMNRDRTINHIRVLDGGSGYPENTKIEIDGDNLIAGELDIVYPSIGREYENRTFKNSVYINRNDQDNWIYSNKRSGIARTITHVGRESLVMPHAGFVKVDEVNHLAYDLIDHLLLENSSILRKDDTIWVANNRYHDWSVYEITEVSVGSIVDDKIFMSLPNDRNFNSMKIQFGMYGFRNQSNRYHFNDGPVLVDFGRGMELHYINYEGGGFVLSDDEHQPLDEDDLLDIKHVYIFTSRRFVSVSSVPSNIRDGKVWVDDYDGGWATLNMGSGTYSVVRQESTYLDTSKFNRLRINENDRTLSDLQVNDPIKGILLSEIESSVDIKSHSDPANYTDKPSATLDDKDVGKVWLDLSSFKYIMYEQPLSIDGKIEDTIDYRRKYWGKVFPKSPVTCYEWVESYQKPSEYEGEGKPKTESDYLEITKYNKALRRFETKYYFWVTDKDSRDSQEKLPVNLIQKYISSGNSNGSSWYSPIYSDDSLFSIAIGNESNTLVNSEGAIDISYVTNDRLGGSHEQWKLVRGNDRFIEIPDVYWERMLASIIGMSRPLDESKYPRGVSIGDGKVVLPVPDPLLSESEKYGINIRPQQTMFSDQSVAMNEFIDALNRSVGGLKMWQERYSGWDSEIPDTSIYHYTDWYEDGFNGVIPNRTFEYYDDLIHFSENNMISEGTIFRVYPFNPVQTDRFEIYQYTDGQFRIVGRQNGKLMIDKSMITDSSSINSRLSLYSLFSAIKDNLLISENVTLLNDVFFTMLNYSLSENKYNDWAFKTSFISFIQDDLELEQRPSFSPNNIGSFISYVEDTKPYHTKIRDIITTYRYKETAYGTVEDWYNMKLKIQFSRHQNDTMVLYSKDINGRFDPISRPLDTDKFDDSNPDYIHTNVIAPDDNVALDANHRSGGELIRLDLNETIIIDVVEDDIVIINGGLWDDHWGWDSQYPEVELSWDNDIEADLNDTMSAKYRMFYSSHTSSYGRAHEMHDLGIYIVNDIPIGNVSTIEVSSDEGLEINGSNCIWIGNEIFTYGNITKRGDRTILQSVRRSMYGTSMSEHQGGSSVYRADRFMTDDEYLLSVDGIRGAEYNDQFNAVQPQYRAINVNRFKDGIPVTESNGQIGKVEVRTPLINPWFKRLDMESPPFSEYGLSGYRKAVYSKASLNLLRWIRR